MSKPAISVVIPAYNCASYLPAAIQSALDQSYPDVEVVVVNDGSPDNTDEVVQPYLDRIVYVMQENKGLSGARNTGFRVSKGDFVCFLDADDILLANKFEKQMAVFEREPDLGVVISGYYDMTDDGQTILQSVRKNWRRDALDHLLNHEVFPPHAPLIRRAALENSALFPEDIVTAESQEDWQLWLDLALNGIQFSSVPEPLCKYRRRPGSISSNPLKHLDGAIRVVRWLRQHPQGRLYRQQIERLAGIIEMERSARAWQTGKSDLAVEILAQAFELRPTYWAEPYTWLRLFTISLRLEELVKWLSRPEPAWFKKIVIEKYLVDVFKSVPPKNCRKLNASAWLMFCDLAYENNDDESRMEGARNAWSSDWKTCLSAQGFPSTLRALFGPRIIAQLKGRRFSREEK